MTLKVTFKEWIILFLVVGIFVAITGFLITFYFNVSGPMVTMISLIIIFVAFKLYQYNKGGGGKEVDYMGEDERID